MPPKGYNLILDKAMDPVIFKYETRNTECGFLVPAPAKFSKVIETYTFMEQFDSHEHMMNTRHGCQMAIARFVVCVWPFGLLDYGSAKLSCKI